MAPNRFSPRFALILASIWLSMSKKSTLIRMMLPGPCVTVEMVCSEKSVELAFYHTMFCLQAKI